jgi:hypothetical protein
MESNYAIYYENRKLWEAKGNVRIVKHDGTKVYTQQLFWNSTTKRIYSNVDTKIVTADDTHLTEGFESDEDMVELNFRHWKGKVMMNENMMSQEEDSTAVEQTPPPANVLQNKPEPAQTTQKSSSRPSPAFRRPQQNLPKPIARNNEGENIRLE